MHSWPRRMLLIGAALMLASAASVAVSVIPAVRADTFPHATPERAVPAFWVAIVLDVLVAGTALASGRFGYRVLAGIMGIVALLLGLALVDAATAYPAHGPAMHAVVVVLWLCVGFDLAGGLSMIASAVTPRRYWGDRA